MIFFNIQLTGLLCIFAFNTILNKANLSQEEIINESIDTLYYETGEIRAILEMKDSLLHGKFFFENGKLLASGAYKNGIINLKCNFNKEVIPQKYRIGEWVFYYNNGQLRNQKSYTNGKRNGLVKEWYPNGQIMIEAIFENGKYNGECYSWFENGNMMESSQFVMGIKDGESKQYFENGILKEKGNYSEGVKIGRWEYWDNQGRLRKTEDYLPNKNIPNK
ncbi:toxin-antitoxin system YwqK family antitoxin [Marinifilum fragile]|uniref:toxin-antitoxin system YwqK family antitoxin n=1 Tax=Marinifilum fragile TaxID=570161 RepID=UPI0006D21910|nr:toxin-antitoxin system YwqK family antitoxin [Marinifilum fragile]